MRSQSISVYLLKDHIQNSRDGLRDPQKLDHHVHNNGDGHTFDVYAPQQIKHPPDWLEFVQPISGTLLDGWMIAPAKAIVFTRVEERTFAIPFGSGNSLLRPESYEHNFGMRVAVNCIDPDRIRAIDALNVSAISLNQRRQTTKATSMIDFAIDVDRDLLLAATGETTDSGLFGRRLSGRDSLKIRKQLNWDEVPKLLSEILKQYGAKTYQKHFKWIDHIAEIRDHVEKARLDDRLEEEIRSGDTAEIALAIPEVIDWEGIEYFKYQKRVTGEKHDDISWESFVASLRPGTPITIDLLKNQEVLCFDESGLELKLKWSIYRCLYFELNEGTSTSILHGGIWYRVDHDYVKEINSLIDAIPEYQQRLPPYAHASEGKYITDSFKTTDMQAVMHEQNIYHGGNSSQIEFCDLFHRQRELIHFKRYVSKKGSTDLSHLFSQGVVSARLMMGDADFRAKLNQKLPAKHQFDAPDSRPLGHEYEVVFGIISKSKVKNSDLPLFSRISLRQAASAISGFGMRISTIHIPDET